MQEANLDKWLKINHFLRISNLLHSPTCALCRAPALAHSSRPAGLCAGCLGDLPWRSRPWNTRMPGVDSTWACFDFTYPIRQLIHRMKFGRDLAAANLLGTLFAYGLRATLQSQLEKPLLCPVPLSRGRQLVRGFNQALEISLPIAARYDLSIDNVSVYKLSAGPHQSQLNAAKRRVNRRNAFACGVSMHNKNVMIIDDVITTGATVRAMAAALRRAGAKRVAVWALAAA